MNEKIGRIRMKKKHLFTIVLIAIVIVLLAVVGIVLRCSKNSARTIKIVEVEGTASVRNVSSIEDAYEGQLLVSGDEVIVNQSSNILLLLDKDKHVYAGEGADFVIVAEGSKGQTKTIVEQSFGAMVYGIDNKLGDGESFEVSTPNANMAVRGTVFTVSITGNDEPVTELAVSEGCVTASTVENGELKTFEINAGENAVFSGTNGTFETDDVMNDTVSDDSEQTKRVIRVSAEVRSTFDDYENQIVEISSAASASGVEGVHCSSAYLILDEPVELTDGYVITKIPCWGMIYENGYEQYFGKHIVADCVIDHTDYSDKSDCTDELFETDYTAQVLEIVTE